MRLSRAQIVYGTAFASDFAYFGFIFASTRLLAETGASQWQLGIFGAASSVSYALSGPLAGAVSDRWGRRRVIVTGLVATMAVLAVCSLWPSRRILYAMSAANGLAVALIYPPMIAWLTEDARDTGRLLYRFCLAWNAGVITGQLSGGWLFAIHPALPMLAGIATLLGALAVVPRWRGDVRRRAPDPDAAPETGEAPARAMTFVYLGWLSNVVGALCFSIIVHLFPYVAHESGISPPVHGTMLAVHRVAVVATYAVMHRFTFWQYRLAPAVAVQFAAIAGLALLAGARSVPLLTAGLVLAAFMLGYNYFAGIYYSTTAFANRRKGMASGVHEATLAVGGAVGALGGGLLGSLYGSRTPYALCVGALALFLAVETVIYARLRAAAARGTTAARC